ncbi:MAG TPA: hypothetical protein VME68_08975 [Acidobacteriaceae bacterium]|nr:hypothetical protein [Acidobacteriaceae bacterium]
MRRVLPVAALGLLLTLAPAAFAQHGGGGHSGGGHVGGFSGFRGGFSDGGFRGGFSAPRSFSGFSGYASRGFRASPRITWSAPRYGAYSAYRPAYGGNSRGWDRRGRYRAPYRGYGYGGYGYPYGYVNSWELLPWDVGYPDFTGYGDDEGSQTQQAQPSDQAQQPPPDYDYAAPPGEGYRGDYAPPPYEPQPVSSTPLGREPQLTLIFRDGHTEAIRNYVLTPTDVVVMDDAATGREPRIPLSDLNVPATEHAAQQAGLDFTPPAS